MSQADLTRQRLVRAALELFTAQGYHVTTTPLIAKKAGVAEGTIYRHFASKQHLLNELYRAAARWGRRLVKEADALNVGPREKLAELGRSLVAGASREPAVARLFSFSVTATCWTTRAGSWRGTSASTSRPWWPRRRRRGP